MSVNIIAGLNGEDLVADAAFFCCLAIGSGFRAIGN
jgi:hypothetical protein